MTRGTPGRSRGRTVCDQLTVIHPEDPVTHALDLTHAVSDDDEAASGLADLVEPGDGTGMEILVTDRQRFVDQQDVGGGGRGDSEGKSGTHARRIRPHGHVGELLEAGKGDQFIGSFLDFGLRDAQGEAAHLDIASPRQPLVQHCAHTEHCRPALGPHLTAGEFKQAGEAEQNRRLAGTVVADDRHALTLGDVKRNIAHRIDVFVATSARS